MRLEDKNHFRDRYCWKCLVIIMQKLNTIYCGILVVIIFCSSHLVRNCRICEPILIWMDFNTWKRERARDIGPEWNKKSQARKMVVFRFERSYRIYEIFGRRWLRDWTSLKRNRLKFGTKLVRNDLKTISRLPWLRIRRLGYKTNCKLFWEGRRNR